MYLTSERFVVFLSILAVEEVTARLTISNIDNAPAYVTEELLDRTSPAFLALETNLANAVSSLLFNRALHFICVRICLFSKKE